MALDIENVVDGGVRGEESLRGTAVAPSPPARRVDSWLRPPLREIAISKGNHRSLSADVIGDWQVPRDIDLNFVEHGGLLKKWRYPAPPIL
jgi:hypothetical protein